MVIIHVHAKVKVKGQLVQTLIETNGRTWSIALPSPLTQSVVSLHNRKEADGSWDTTRLTWALTHAHLQPPTRPATAPTEPYSRLL